MAVRCTFCGHEIEAGTGNDVISPDGKTLHFCSRKCRVNMLKLRRDPKKKKWTTHYGEGRK